MATVLVINILNDFLAPLMLEINVNIRRLVTLLGDEPFEQQVHARRIHLSDSEHVTDR